MEVAIMYILRPGLRVVPQIIIQDIDGDANGGEFANDTIDINYQSAIVLVKGENFVDQGTYKIVQDIHLKKK